jgi:hypothetical protein
MGNQWFAPGDLYPVVEAAAALDDEDWQPGSNGEPRWKRNVRDVLLYRKPSGTNDLDWDPPNHRYRLR